MVFQTGCFTSLGKLEAFALAVEHQLGVVDEGHAVGVGELLSAGTDEVDVRAFFQNQARGLDWVAEALDTGHAASLHAAAVHEQSVELDAAIGGEETAAAGVEGGVVFENGDGGFDGVQRRAATSEYGVAGFKSITHACFVGGRRLGGDGPCAAVDEEDGGVSGRGRHWDMVEHCAGWLSSTGTNTVFRQIPKIYCPPDSRDRGGSLRNPIQIFLCFLYSDWSLPGLVSKAGGESSSVSG